MPRGDPSLDSRLLVGGMVGAGCGAVVGLVLFGGILLVPAALMILGAIAGVSTVGGEQASRRPRVPARSRPVRPRVRRGARSIRVRVPRRSRSAEPARVGTRVTGPVRIARPRPDQPPVDVNTADVEELTRLPGIGRAAAARIIAHREQHGPFEMLRDIEHVEGFDQARVARLAPRAMLSAPAEAHPDGDAPAGGPQAPD